MGNDGVGQRVGRPRRSGVQGESPREEIVGAAARLFAAAGYAQTSVSAIAREAGLGQSSLYYWFANKEAILQALIDKNRESLETARELVDATDSPAHRLYRIVYVDVVQMCSSPLDFYELERVARAQPEAFDEFFSDYRELERLIARVIRQGVAAGEFRDVDATATTTAALALSEGLQYRFRQGEQDVRRMRELAHLSASTTVAALVRDRRRVRSARAAAEELD
ncbi:TetR/AcrR family transcriptional regulator [Prescottella equi]|uniref:TetR/AcrR family transcriptional regulator n=1 Tax=Rhodococcus hoagii TaxID=43767 RepID=UPI001C790718|nr:TetR/AcrR family transcriptional regulator [Prescottella equi]BCN46115.1 transcriptional regulator [Prescottella equi]